jgi:hypothetical protein
LGEGQRRRFGGQRMSGLNYDDILRLKIKEITLMLLYLNSWKDTDISATRSWKGYDFDDLNKLAEEGFISEGRRAKSVVLFEEGIEEAKRLLKAYGVVD